MERWARGWLLCGLLLVAGVLLAGPAAAAPPPDPATDVIGWENGYWYNESIEVDQGDGLSEAERMAYVNRTAARVEVLRGLEFSAPVPVTVVPRDEYRNQTAGNASDAYRAWNNQVWEALFVVGEDEDVEDVLHSTASSATTGAYVYTTDEIQIVTDSPDQPAIDRGTLAHELVHALHDQHYNLSAPRFQGHTQDEQLAILGLVEGDANYVEANYQERCWTDWECVGTPSTISGGSGGGDVNRGVLFTLYQPYSDGTPYVHSLVESGGWAAVNEAFERPPSATEQVIHVTNEEPVPLSVEDEATAGWRTFPDEGVNGTDTTGEASMFAMLWYQASEHNADTINPAVIQQNIGEYDEFNYDAPPTAGWGNDAVLPYQRYTVTGPEYGYVWVTEWESDRDAREFERAYHAILDAHDARPVGPQTWVIESGSPANPEPFADAFRVVRDGRTLTIVNGPEIDDLDDIRPSLPGQLEEPGTPTQEPPPGSPMEPEATPTEDGSLTEAPPQAGFGPLAAAAGLVGWLLFRRRRRP